AECGLRRKGQGSRESGHVGVEAQHVRRRQLVTLRDLLNGRSPDVGLEPGAGGARNRRHYVTRSRNRRVRSWLGEEKSCRGGASSTTRPSSIISTEPATCSAKRSSCVTTTIVIPSRARPSMTSSTSRTSS